MASASALASPQLRPVATPVQDSRIPLLDAIVLYGTASALMFGPLAFGAVEAWATFALQLLAVALVLLWSIRQVSAARLEITWNPLFAPMLALGVVIAAQLLLGTSAYRYSTTSSGLLYVTYGIFAFLTIQTLQRTAQVKTLAWMFSVYGAAVALFALVQSLSSNGKLYWVRSPRSGGWIYGPYVNHNHYAGFMEMLFPVALVISLSRSVGRKIRWTAGSAAVLMAGTIFLSGSRGGMIAFVAQMALLTLIARVQKNRRAALAASLVIISIAALILWIGGQELTTRITSIHSEAKTELDTGVRMRIDRDGLRMFSERPVLGWGLGNFPVVYPQFRSFFTDKFVNRAHNDYLQLLTETGLAGFGTMVWFLIVVYRRAIKKLENWHADMNGAVALAMLLSCTGILVHSFLDSNLQIPANAALFYCMCTLAAAGTNFGSHRRPRARTHGDS